MHKYEESESKWWTSSASNTLLWSGAPEGYCVNMAGQSALYLHVSLLLWGFWWQKGRWLGNVERRQTEILGSACHNLKTTPVKWEINNIFGGGCWVVGRVCGGMAYGGGWGWWGRGLGEVSVMLIKSSRPDTSKLRRVEVVLKYATESWESAISPDVSCHPQHEN